MVFKSILILTSLAFLYYGINCLFSQIMNDEFLRFGLTKKQRHLTGVLQVIGALGLISGLSISRVGMFAALGLTILMILGFIVRLKIKDSFLQSLPSFIFIWINLYLFYMFYKSL